MSEQPRNLEEIFHQVLLAHTDDGTGEFHYEECAKSFVEIFDAFGDEVNMIAATFCKGFLSRADKP